MGERYLSVSIDIIHGTGSLNQHVFPSQSVLRCGGGVGQCALFGIMAGVDAAVNATAPELSFAQL